MLTIFSIPKPFRGNIAVTQRNAIRSWTLMRPTCEIILFGDEEGIAEAAAEMNVRHIPVIARNEFGTPLVSDAFQEAARCSTKNILCYINSDIILCKDFLPAMERVANKKQRFLMVGQRWNLDLNLSVDFDQNWVQQISDLVKERGRLEPRYSIDYFVFPKGLFREIPPFAVGRPGWDHWMIYYARISGYSVIDVSKVVKAVHQNHDYSHVPQRKGPRYEGPESKRNLSLLDDYSHSFTIDDANYVLTKNYIRPAIARRVNRPCRPARNSLIKLVKGLAGDKLFNFVKRLI